MKTQISATTVAVLDRDLPENVRMIQDADPGIPFAYGVEALVFEECTFDQSAMIPRVTLYSVP